jgi:glycerophosphoryl diester phosphodiesterase
MIAGIPAVATLELDLGRTKDGVLVVLTVNDLGVADRLIGWGVDGLITEYPDRVRGLLTDKGVVLRVP